VLFPGQSVSPRVNPYRMSGSPQGMGWRLTVLQLSVSAEWEVGDRSVSPQLVLSDIDHLAGAGNMVFRTVSRGLASGYGFVDDQSAPGALHGATGQKCGSS
jgi:hypothetical protein